MLYSKKKCEQEQPGRKLHLQLASNNNVSVEHWTVNKVYTTTNVHKIAKIGGS